MTKESSEESYLVFDNNNKGGLCELLVELGEWYNQDSIYFKPKGSLTGYLLGTNDADFPGYHEKGTESRFMVSTASNYMPRLGNSAFAFVSDDAIKNDNKVQAMAEIEKEIVDQGYPNQHYWKDNPKTSFGIRKKQRIEKNKEEQEKKNKQISNEAIIYNLFQICENTKGGCHIDNLYSLHPLTRKSLCEHYKKTWDISNKMNNKTIKLTENHLRRIVEETVKNVLNNNVTNNDISDEELLINAAPQEIEMTGGQNGKLINLSIFVNNKPININGLSLQAEEKSNFNAYQMHINIPSSLRQKGIATKLYLTFLQKYGDICSLYSNRVGTYAAEVGKTEEHDSAIDKILMSVAKQANANIEYLVDEKTNKKLGIIVSL